MDIANFVRPRTIEEAHTFLTEKKAFLIGGGAWCRMSPRKVEYAVDLSSLDLRYIRRNGDAVEIGAMATARDVETSSVLQDAFGHAFSDAVGRIVGIQMRNVVSVGGTVAGRFGFSDLNTLLLALGASVVIHGEGAVDLGAYLTERRSSVGIIEKIVLKPGVCAFRSLQNSSSDLPVLNCAVACTSNGWRIAVGARPGPSRLASQAAALLGTTAKPDAKSVADAARAAAGEISFRPDIRATADYRKSVCETLVRRALTEVSR